MKKNKVSLGYWGLRGRGQIPRLLLAYTGELWENVQYVKPEQWKGGDKDKIGLPFPNLPYLIDGNLKLTETAAICEYIIDKSPKKQLLGKNIQDRAMILNVVGVLNEIFESAAKILYTPDGLELRQSVKDDTILPKLKYIFNFMNGKDWILGYLTYADFVMAELSYYLQKIYPQEYKQWIFLHNHRFKFNSIPQMVIYYDQPQSVKGPFTNTTYSNIKF